MQAEVDQSGKIEWTQKQTVLALANDVQFSIQISSREKRKVIPAIQRLRPHWNKRLIHVFIFSILVFLLIRNYIKKDTYITIDTEYTGYEALIKDRVMELCRKDGIAIRRDQIIFKQIGKKSPAHEVAIYTFRGNIKPNKTIKAEDVLALFGK